MLKGPERPRFQSAGECWDIEAIQRIDAILCTEDAAISSRIEVSPKDLSRVLRLARIGIEAERLYHVLGRRDDAR